MRDAMAATVDSSVTIHPFAGQEGRTDGTMCAMACRNFENAVDEQDAKIEKWLRRAGIATAVAVLGAATACATIWARWYQMNRQ